jgi:hypothetical protein
MGLLRAGVLALGFAADCPLFGAPASFGPPSLSLGLNRPEFATQ